MVLIPTSFVRGQIFWNKMEGYQMFLVPRNFLCRYVHDAPHRPLYFESQKPLLEIEITAMF